MSYDTYIDRDFIAEANEERREPLLPEVVFCAYCDAEMARPPVMSAWPMCPNCRDKHLHGEQKKAGAA